MKSTYTNEQPLKVGGHGVEVEDVDGLLDDGRVF